MAVNRARFWWTHPHIEHAMNIRLQAWRILNDPEDARYVWFHRFINTLILLSVGLVVYEVQANPANEELATLRLIDDVVLAIFLVEYLGRLWVVQETYPKSVKLTNFQKLRYWLVGRLKFMLSPWGLVDLVALLPLFPFLRSLRILRLLRLLRSVQFFRFARPVETLFAAFRDNVLLFAVATAYLFGTVTLASIMMFLAEYRINKNISHIGDTLWWSIVTITTVGFGDITPETTGGRVIGAILMFSGMFVVAMFAGVISSTLVGHLLPLRQEQVRMSSLADHIVLVGWNSQVPMTLQEMRREFKNAPNPPKVLVFAYREKPEYLDSDILWVQGDFTKEDQYDKIRLQYARTAVVVADEHKGSTIGARDGVTVLTIFTMRSFVERSGIEREEPLHIVAEILDPENYKHAVIAGADEVIETARVGCSMIAHTAGNPGVGTIVSDLVITSGDNIYASTLPVELMDGDQMDFRALQRRAQDDLGILIIGVEHKGVKSLNPPPTMPVFLSDKIIYMGKMMLR